MSVTAERGVGEVIVKREHRECSALDRAHRGFVDMEHHGDIRVSGLPPDRGRLN
jgi:hypothetical protein